MADLTDRQKIAHLLRRFGLGSSRQEMEELSRLGVDGALDRLIDYEKQPEGFPVNPYQVCFEEGKAEVYVDPFRFAGVWGLRMAMTQRPLEQKLTLFWHDHFAVSADKVGIGPPMWDYVECLRRNALDFKNILREVSYEPAMLRWLDGDTSIKDHPNENFGRELLELFTVGIGHYSEEDVKQVARAFTGWGNRYLIYEGGGEPAQVQERIKDSVVSGEPMIAASFSPALHDYQPVKFLDATAASADELLAKLAIHPLTAEYITGKLWDYFASVPASEATRANLKQTFLQSQGAIKPVLRQIAAAPEFWSEACVLHRVKSPADFVVPVVRQLGLDAYLLAATKDAKTETPMAKPLRDTSGLIIGMMYQQGMLLMYPPNVAGWDWGEAWITPGNMLARMNMASLLCGVGQPDQGIAAYIGGEILKTKPADATSGIRFVCDMFDANLPDAKVAVLVEAFEKGGGIAGLTTPSGASKALSGPMKLMFGAPEFQMC